MNTDQRELVQLEEISSLLTEIGASTAFLVVDSDAYDASGARDVLRSAFHGLHVVEFFDFCANPKLEDVCRGVKAFRNTRSDVIIAIGGGTAIDTAKLIRCFSAQQAQPREIIQDPGLITAAACPLIAVPTTAGTGSEATHFAVVFVDRVKNSVAHPSILPNVAIVDSRLSRSMPRHVTAVTGLDAFCQAIESMWSVRSTPRSIDYARLALDLVVKNLVDAVRQPTGEVRANMSRAANLAGKAINISKTTAPHALSYEITMNHGVAHGHAAALTLGPILAFNRQVTRSDLVDRRGLKHVHDVIDDVVVILGCQSVTEAKAAIESLMVSIGCGTRLRDVGITTRAERKRIARSANVERLSNNPRALSERDIEEILDSIS